MLNSCDLVFIIALSLNKTGTSLLLCFCRILLHSLDLLVVSH